MQARAQWARHGPYCKPGSSDSASVAGWRPHDGVSETILLRSLLDASLLVHILG